MTSASGELSEALMNLLRGAFNWYQFVQIPIEIFMPLLLNHFGCDRIQAYGGAKLISFLTSVGIGFVAGPMGALGAAAMWIVSEFISWLFRKLIEISPIGDQFKDVFGESRTEALAKRIYNWFMVKIEMGMVYGLKWFYNLPNSSIKKLA